MQNPALLLKATVDFGAEGKTRCCRQRQRRYVLQPRVARARATLGNRGLSDEPQRGSVCLVLSLGAVQLDPQAIILRSPEFAPRNDLL